MVFALWLILGLSTLYGTDAFDDDISPPAPYNTSQQGEGQEEYELLPDCTYDEERYTSDDEFTLLGKISRSSSPDFSDDEYEDRCVRNLQDRCAKNVEQNELLQKCLKTLSPQEKQNLLNFLRNESYEKQILNLSRQVKSTAQEILTKKLNDRPDKVAISIDDLQASFFITDYPVQRCIFEFLIDCILNETYDRLALFGQSDLLKSSSTPLKAMNDEMRYYLSIIESINVSKVSCRHIETKQPLIFFNKDHRKQMCIFIRFGLDFYLEQYKNKSVASVTTEYLGRGSDTRKFFDDWLTDSKALFGRLFGREHLKELAETTDACVTQFNTEQDKRLGNVQAVFSAPSVATQAVASGFKSVGKTLGGWWGGKKK